EGEDRLRRAGGAETVLVDRAGGGLGEPVRVRGRRGVDEGLDGEVAGAEVERGRRRQVHVAGGEAAAVADLAGGLRDADDVRGVVAADDVLAGSAGEGGGVVREPAGVGGAVLE